MGQRRSGAGRGAFAGMVLDDRTDDLSNASLICRTINHRTEFLPVKRARREELLRVGQMELIRHCDRCGTTYTDLIELETGEVLHTRPKYPEGYLLTTKGQGRLPRREARKAMLTRLDIR